MHSGAMGLLLRRVSRSGPDGESVPVVSSAGRSR